MTCESFHSTAQISTKILSVSTGGTEISCCCPAVNDAITPRRPLSTYRMPWFQRPSRLRRSILQEEQCIRETISQYSTDLLTPCRFRSDPYVRKWNSVKNPVSWEDNSQRSSMIRGPN